MLNVCKKSIFTHSTIILLTTFGVLGHKSKVESLTTSDVSFLTKVCLNTIQQSTLKEFYVTSLNPHFPGAELMQSLHENHITIQLTIHQQKNWDTFYGNERVKNILFILNKRSDVLSLIFSSLYYTKEFKGKRPKLVNGKRHLLASNGSSGNIRLDLSSDWDLPNYCITYGYKTNVVSGDLEEYCHEKMHVSYGDLDECSTLPDHIFNAVRSSYPYQVWNADNYLIFMIPGVCTQKTGINPMGGQENISSSSTELTSTEECHRHLLFIFRFLWRIFKAYRTVICSEDKCYRYDPFYDKILIYNGRRGEQYFNFTWLSMNGQMTAMLVFEGKKKSLGYDTAQRPWEGVLSDAYHELSVKRHSREKGYHMIWPNDTPAHSSHNYEAAIKYGVDPYVVEFDANLNASDFSRFDFLTTVDTRSLCFIVPRQGFIPQYLTIFRCFSLTAWICIIITSGVFLLIQHAYNYFQTKVFQHLYSDTELNLYLNASASLAVYRYLLCIGQPTLLLGKLMTGKILFCVIVFPALILVTLFQSRMVTLLSNHVRYEDITTLQEIKESDLLVQSLDIDADGSFFKLAKDFDWIQKRLVESFLFENGVLLPLDYGYHPFQYFDWEWNDTSANTILDIVVSDVAVSSGLKSMDAVLRSDAFFTNVPANMLGKEDKLFYDQVTRQKYEYHLVRECIMNYPFMYLVQKHSYLRDPLNDFMTRYLESGLKDFRIRNVEGNFRHSLQTAREVANQSQRPYSMTDLSFAFICLATGHALSFAVFIGELLYQF